MSVYKKKKRVVMLDKDFIILDKKNNKYILMDNNGYKYSIHEKNYKKRNPRMTDTTNPYSIYNIKKWLKDNNKEMSLLSCKYISNSDKMVWKCKCGKIFEASWSKVRYRNRELCKECSLKNRIEKSKKIDSLLKEIKKSGYKVLTKSIKTCDDYICIKDKDGYKYKLIARSVPKRKHQAIVNSNPFVIENIKRN